MKQIALALVASLIAIASAHAQAWPNAAPSPYGQATAPAETPTESQPVPSASTNGTKLGSPPHALGAPMPNAPATNPAPATENSTTSPVPVAEAGKPGSSRATTALNVLEAQGYANFSDFRPDGDMFTAVVNDGGQQFRVGINPDTGQITRQ
jgi:hypothetical protein